MHVHLEKKTAPSATNQRGMKIISSLQASVDTLPPTPRLPQALWFFFFSLFRQASSARQKEFLTKYNNKRKKRWKKLSKILFWSWYSRRNALRQWPSFHRSLILHVLDLLPQCVLVHVCEHTGIHGYSRTPRRTCSRRPASVGV